MRLFSFKCVLYFPSLSLSQPRPRVASANDSGDYPLPRMHRATSFRRMPPSLIISLNNDPPLRL